MEPFDAITVNDRTIKVRNPTDYYLDQWIYADYGIEILYVPRRGIDEVFWNELLLENGFQDPRKVYKGKARYYQLECRNRSLDLHEFMTRSFVLVFVSGNIGYELFYDHGSSTIVVDNTYRTFRNLL